MGRHRMRVHRFDFRTAHHVGELPGEFHCVFVSQMRIAFEALANVELGDDVAHTRGERPYHLIEMIYGRASHASGVEMQDAINV